MNGAAGPGRADGAEGLKVGAEDGALGGHETWLSHIGKSLNSMGRVGVLRYGSFISLSLYIYI